jgi:hypothetical protein
MPKLYEYFGISVFFYADEPLPVHVHGRYGSQETNAEIITSAEGSSTSGFKGWPAGARSPARLGRGSGSLSGPKPRIYWQSGPRFSF